MLNITDVIGGNNPNQYFCMTLSGTLVDPNDYIYNKIAPEDNVTSFASDNVENIKARFDEMNTCIFPTYPVFYVIAKDVSIRFTAPQMLEEYNRALRENRNEIKDKGSERK